MQIIFAVINCGSEEAQSKVVLDLMVKDDEYKNQSRTWLVRGDCKEASLDGMCEKIMCGDLSITKQVSWAENSDPRDLTSDGLKLSAQAPSRRCMRK